MIKVKGHVTEADVEGQVRLEDRLGNIEADTAADLDGRHQSEADLDVRRAVVNAMDLWYPFFQQHLRFVIAVSRVPVNHDGRGGSSSDPLVW